MGTLQAFWAGILPVACSALQRQGCTDPHRSPGASVFDGTWWYHPFVPASPKPGCVRCVSWGPSSPASLLTRTMGAPLVGQWLTVGHVISSPCCFGVRELKQKWRGI